jgi:2-polyprenyl-3-methyl-5-hydroxy-6-metoxy-1,4-benzoquinol methylase
MKASSHPSRSSPLLGRPGPSRPLDVAPPPWHVRECLETGLVYLANPPAQEQYREEFAWEVTHADESARRQREEPLVYAASRAFKTFRHRWLKRDKLVDLVGGLARRRPSGPIRLVDIGCSDGDLFRRLVARLPAEVAGRIEPVGIEISTQLAASADRRLRLHGGRCIHAAGIDGLEQLAAGSVHVVILSCVLEHELAPVELLAACRGRLAADGVVVVKVPNYACLARRVRGRRWCGYRWPDHVNYFTPATLAATAARAGLTVTRMRLADRSPLSDSLYAVFARDPTAERSLPRLAAAA